LLNGKISLGKRTGLEKRCENILGWERGKHIGGRRQSWKKKSKKPPEVAKKIPKKKTTSRSKHIRKKAGGLLR